jgi:SNF2 family DNA or RNA helicase
MQATNSVVSKMNFKLKPWQHQLDAIERAARFNHFALFFEMGTGKTLTSINCLRWKFSREGRLLRTLIVGPPIVLENWQKELKLNSNINPKDITVLYGPGAKRKESFLARAFEFVENLLRPKPHIFITNYETLTVMPELFALIQKWEPEAIVWDEAHKLKSGTSSRTKAAIKLSDRAKYRYILTGTPVLNSPMDLFAQFRVLDKGETFGQNFFAFRATYFYDKNAGMPKQKYFPDWRIRPDALDNINARIKRLSARVKKEECMDLPPLVRKEVYVELGKEQKKHYDMMKKEFITFLGDKACTAELALTKGLRLQQIASGYLKLEDGKEIELKDNPRQDALRALLEELTPQHKVLVWACFRQNYEQIRKVCDELKIKYVEVHGEISGARRFENVDAFNSDPTIRVFIGHPGSGGIGINLVSASYSIFYSRSFSLEHDLQAESRNHRGGSGIHAKITRIDLIAKDSIDSLIAERLFLKEAISERVLKDVARKL